MWVLDPANSGELIDLLGRHSVRSALEVVWCGEGWKALVGACHEEVVAAFPEYCLVVVEQKQGSLAFEALPRSGDSTAKERLTASEITDRYATASATVCEWCSLSGSLRPVIQREALRPTAFGPVTLCDACAEEVKTTNYPTSAPIV